MKKYKFSIRLCDMFFKAWVIGAGFSTIMVFASGRPIRSAGCILISIGMALLSANIEVYIREQALLARDAQVAQKVYREVRNNDLYKAS